MKHFQDVGASPDGKLTDKREPETKKEEESEGGAKPVEVPELGEQAFGLRILTLALSTSYRTIAFWGSAWEEKTATRFALVKQKTWRVPHWYS